VLGNALAWACVRLIRLCDRLAIELRLEQPALSLMWLLPEMRSAVDGRRSYEALFDWCHYQRHWKTFTRIVGRAPYLAGLSAFCRGGHEHEVLQGARRDDQGRWRNRTAIAAEYSACFCRRFAQVASAHVEARGVSAGEGWSSTKLSDFLEKGLASEAALSSGTGRGETSGSGSGRPRWGGMAAAWHL